MILDQTIDGGNTSQAVSSSFVNNAALDEVKDSIQELRSILLRGRGGPYPEPYYAVEMDGGSRRSRHSGGFGPPSFETNNGPIILPASQGHPPPGITPIMWQPNPGEQLPHQVIQLPRRSPIIIPAVRSRSSSRERRDIPESTLFYRTSGRKELESVIGDFSSIVIIVSSIFFRFLSFLISHYRFLIGNLPRLCVHRHARTRSQRIRQPRHAEIECQPSF